MPVDIEISKNNTVSKRFRASYRIIWSASVSPKLNIIGFVSHGHVTKSENRKIVVSQSSQNEIEKLVAQKEAE